jgi:hypothetical protein
MARLVAPDKGVREIDVASPSGTKRYRPDGGGLYNVENPKHARQMKAEGFFEASLMSPTTDRNLGYTCNACGFGSWFKKCSKCGEENE